MDFLSISGCDTSLYHSQGGAKEISLCDPDGEFGRPYLVLYIKIPDICKILRHFGISRLSRHKCSYRVTYSVFKKWLAILLNN